MQTWFWIGYSCVLSSGRKNESAFDRWRFDKDFFLFSLSARARSHIFMCVQRYNLVSTWFRSIFDRKFIPHLRVLNYQKKKNSYPEQRIVGAKKTSYSLLQPIIQFSRVEPTAETYKADWITTVPTDILWHYSWGPVINEDGDIRT